LEDVPTQVSKASTHERLEGLSIRSPDSNDLSNSPDEFPDSLAAKLANGGGRMIRFFGDKAQFFSCARAIQKDGGYDQLSGKQVHLLEPLDWLVWLPAESIAGVVPRLKLLLDERQDVARYSVAGAQRELTRLLHYIRMSLEAKDCCFDSKSENPAYWKFPEPEAFKRSLESALSSDVVVVQPIVCTGSVFVHHKSQLLSYLKILSQGGAGNLVWLIVSDGSFNECFDDLVSETIKPD
jgi:hypothetical protein